MHFWSIHRHNKRQILMLLLLMFLLRAEAGRHGNECCRCPMFPTSSPYIPPMPCPPVHCPPPPICPPPPPPPPPTFCPPPVLCPPMISNTPCSLPQPCSHQAYRCGPGYTSVPSIYPNLRPRLPLGPVYVEPSRIESEPPLPIEIPRPPKQSTPFDFPKPSKDVHETENIRNINTDLDKIIYDDKISDLEEHQNKKQPNAPNVYGMDGSTIRRFSSRKNTLKDLRSDENEVHQRMTLTAENECCSDCDKICRFRRHKTLAAAAPTYASDPTCNNPSLRYFMKKVSTTDIYDYKKRIQHVAEQYLGGHFNVICGIGKFAYITHTQDFCLYKSLDITCYAFRSLNE